jgi:iron(III) transport system substrate-binding protein
MPISLILVCSLGCRSSGPEVVVYTSVDQVFSDPVLRAFETESGVHVRAVFDTEETKSTGVVNRLIAESASPQADVFWSGDPVRPFLLIKRDLVEPYVSPAASSIPGGFKDGGGLWTGLGGRARVLLVSNTRLEGRAAPRSIRDLASPAWRGEGAIANPLFGTTTMHVGSLAATWGEEETKRFLDALRPNGVRVASSNGEVKRLVVSGQVTFGLTDSDDAHEAVESGADVSVVHPDQEAEGTLFMPTSVVLLRGAPHPEQARRLIDFLSSPEAERRLIGSGSHLPLRPSATPAADGSASGGVRYMTVDYGRASEMMESLQPWLRQWAGL